MLFQGHVTRPIAALFTLLLVSLLAACSSGAPEATTSAAPAPALVSVSPADCEWMTTKAPGAGPEVVIVADPTASARRSQLPTPVSEALLAAAQSAGSVSVLLVDGPSASPTWVLRKAALADPTATGTSRGERLVAVAPSCVTATIQSARAQAPGTDLLAALQELGRNYGSAASGGGGARTAQAATGGTQAWIMSDGLANGGVVDLNALVIGESPIESVITEVTDGGEAPRLGGLHVMFLGLGDANGPSLSQSVRTWLYDLWQGICESGGAESCAVDPQTGAAAADAAPADLPADPIPAGIPAPETVTVTDDGTRTLTLPSTVSFTSDSCELHLSPKASRALDGFATEMLAIPSARVIVSGHTAMAGTAEGRKRLSLCRAEKVAQALRDRGVPDESLEVRGLGATQRRAIDRLPDGSWDEVAAARNRRVTVSLPPR